MANKIKLLSVPLALSLMIFTGCSNEEASSKTEEGMKKTEQQTKEAASKIKEKSKEAAAEVKKETPGIVQNMKDTYKKGEKEVKDNTLQKGDKAKIEKDAYLAQTPEAYDELYQLIKVNDFDGIKNIEKESKVKEIKKDSEVEVLERDIRRTKVKVKESGEEGYLPTNLLQPVK